MKIEDSINETLKRLVYVPSISGTEAENLAAEKIFEILMEIQYFKVNKDSVRMHNIEGDKYNRCFVTALLKGKNDSKRTIILTGHFDVVGIEEFGHLKEYAFDMDEFTKRAGEVNLNIEAKNDLESGDWLFGRGTADMKYGIALDIEILREMSTKIDLEGNILFLAVPGEESNSEGMLAAVNYLAELQNDDGYDFCGLINAECCFPKAPGDDEKKVYLGTCGKVMPVFFCVGKETHACTPFEGLNPNLIISHINSLMELNTDFCDAVGNDVTPPPTCLKQTDLKDLYSVQTPLYAAAYYNCISLVMDGNKVLKKLKSVADKAFNDSMDEVKTNYQEFENLNNGELKRGISQTEAFIISFSELYKCVSEKIGHGFESEMEYLVQEWMKEGYDNQTIGIRLIKETYERYQDKRPMVIVGFIPPFYPDKILNTDSEKDLKLYRAVESTIELAKVKYNVEIKKENYFMGICDLSYTGFKDDRAEKIHSNMASRSNYMLPFESLMKIDIPSIVFGGWGKDFHKVTERLNKSYSLKIVPDLYLNLIHEILK